MTVDDVRPADIQEAVMSVKSLSADIQKKYPVFDTYSVGLVEISYAWFLAASQDIATVLPIAMIVIFVGMSWFFGSISVTIATIIITALSIEYALGALGYYGGMLVPITAAGLIMILILSVADAVHILSTASLLVEKGDTNEEAIENSVVRNFKPIALTSITTAIGFLFFNTSEFHGLRSLGTLVAIGIMVAFVLSVTLLPALLSYCIIKSPRQRLKLKRYTQIANLVLKYRSIILIISFPFILVCIWLAQTNVIDDGMSKYLSNRTDYKKALTEFENSLTGSINLMYNIKTGQENAINDPKFMSQVDALTQWFREQPEVRHVNSYTDIMRRLNRDLNFGDPDYYIVPEDPELASQYLLLYELSLPFGLDLTNIINLDKSGTLLTVSINDIEMGHYFAINDRAIDWMNVNMPDYVTETSGPSYTMAVATDINFIQMLEGAISSLVIVILVLIISFRSVYIGLICGIAIVGPILVSFAIWALLIGNIGIAAAAVIGMVIGITVDNAVHFMSKYLYSRTELQKSKDESIRFTFANVGEPLFINSVALGIGFSILGLSNFTIYFEMGLLTSLTLIFALLATFTIVPSLLMLQFNRK